MCVTKKISQIKNKKFGGAEFHNPFLACGPGDGNATNCFSINRLRSIGERLRKQNHFNNISIDYKVAHFDANATYISGSEENSTNLQEEDSGINSTFEMTPIFEPET